MPGRGTRGSSSPSTWTPPASQRVLDQSETHTNNALMESTIGLYKPELISLQRPWKGLSQVELATAEWTDWYVHRRLHGEIGHNPPAEC
ncbi:integrase core domain-containing protein [Streptomyces sp. NPDC058653]|uniref:integrase core domain-containing protein n=1 Tax=Streptomyces sp. NPDC058653 TaxID=3346576 RepID=UPI003653BBB4